ncbi:hypothetical protein D3C81_1227620 [compost metagenome]
MRFVSSNSGLVNSSPVLCFCHAVKTDLSWDVIEAVEGVKPIFQCKNILRTNMMYLDKEWSSCTCTSGNPSCTINLTMLEAEEHMREFLRNKTLAWLNKELVHTLPEKVQTDTREYFIKKKY